MLRPLDSTAFRMHLVVTVTPDDPDEPEEEEALALPLLQAVAGPGGNTGGSGGSGVGRGRKPKLKGRAKRLKEAKLKELEMRASTSALGSSPVEKPGVSGLGPRRRKREEWQMGQQQQQHQQQMEGSDSAFSPSGRPGSKREKVKIGSLMK